MICPLRKEKDGTAKEPTKAELNGAIRYDPKQLANIRSRLSDISWWMRLICQRIGTSFNREDQKTGKFWEARFKAVRLLDEESLLACAAYVDLNPIRAALAQTLEKSDFTSVQRRIQALAQGPSRDGFLAPIGIDEQHDPLGPHPSSGPYRCSDKGVLALRTADYLELLDWTALPGKAVSWEKSRWPVGSTADSSSRTEAGPPRSAIVSEFAFHASEGLVAFFGDRPVATCGWPAESATLMATRRFERGECSGHSDMRCAKERSAWRSPRRKISSYLPP